MAILVSKYLSRYQDAKNLTAEDLLNLLQATDAFRRPARFNDFLLSCAACSTQSATTDWLLACHDTAQTIEIKEWTAQYTGQALAQKIREKHCQTIQSWLNKSYQSRLCNESALTVLHSR